VGSVVVHSVCGDIVMSWILELDFLVKVPIALNWTGLAAAEGAVVATQVVLAAGRGVNVAVTVGLGVLLDVGVGMNVGVGSGPSAIVIEVSLNPGLGVAVGPPPLLPPPQLSKIAPKTRSRTGATTSHLSHRDNIKASAMTTPSRPVKLMRHARAKFTS
jgi:hypothetical protein